VSEPPHSLLQVVAGYLPNHDLKQLEAAYRCAEAAHEGIISSWGEPIINGAVQITELCVRLRLDQASLVAALLYASTDEECCEIPLTFSALKVQFGPDVASIVEGVATLTQLEFGVRQDREAESFRMMLLALARDIRTVLVKLCERLYKLRVAEFLVPDRQRSLAFETQEVYAPLANRLGIHWLKSELQDFVLLYLRPEVYKYIHESFGAAEAERESYVKETSDYIQKTLRENNIQATIKGRAKHYYSVWQKMEKNNLNFEEIHDLLGFRVLVPSLRECYEALGVIHHVWKPVPGRFKDYIGMPKSNFYQSLHTTVIGPQGKRIEVQIRTVEMNMVAEEGIAAHWRYKERLEPSAGVDLSWVKELIENQAYVKQPEEFVRSVKSDLFPDQVVVFTPNGDIKRLPAGATCLDFAYAVHTDVGNTMTGAKVNGHMVPINHEIENGDTIEVITSKNQHPGKDWVNMVRSTRAKQRIRVFLRAEERTKAIEHGLELLGRDLRTYHSSIKKVSKEGKLEALVKGCGFGTLDDLCAAIGYGKLAVGKVLLKLFPEVQTKSAPNAPSSPMQRIFTNAAKASREKVGVIVDGLDQVVVRYARCCTPLPGDRIVGFISRGRGISIHHAECSSVEQFDPMRVVTVEWDVGVKPRREVTLTVHSQDQRGLLVKMSEAITLHGADVRGARCSTSQGGKVVNSFDVIVSDTAQLNRIKRALELVGGVTKVERKNSHKR
jgi:GTP diphosphokinase / guanosine-3',5'-bis(diphosphate) 3'-diphosphatase